MDDALMRLISEKIERLGAALVMLDLSSAGEKSEFIAEMKETVVSLQTCEPQEVGRILTHVLKTMKRFIKKLGCAGAYAGNGLEAIEMIRRYNFDLCFMDLLMPEMGGVDAAYLLRTKYRKRLPIIAVTSQTMTADQQRCHDVGMNDFVPKPIDFQTIKEKIQQYGINEI